MLAMKNKAAAGGTLALIAAAMGIIGHFVLFLNWYQVGMNTPSAEPGCEILLKYIHPMMAYLGILAGGIFIVSAYGFFTRKDWAVPLSIIAIVFALLASWFINVPFMAAGLPPVYFPLFWPYLALYFLLVVFIAGIPWRLTLLGLLTGMAYIFCYMNGVASTSRIITIGAPIFVLVDGLHWVAMAGWAVVTVGLLLRPTEWMRVVGLIAGVLELTVGIPLTIATAQQLGRFSLFALAPLSCLVLVVILVWPGLWQRITEKNAFISPRTVVPAKP
jgi:hypothetical protein